MANGFEDLAIDEGAEDMQMEDYSADLGQASIWNFWSKFTPELIRVLSDLGGGIYQNTLENKPNVAIELKQKQVSDLQNKLAEYANEPGLKTEAQAELDVANAELQELMGETRLQTSEKLWGTPRAIEKEKGKNIYEQGTKLMTQAKSDLQTARGKAQEYKDKKKELEVQDYLTRITGDMLVENPDITQEEVLLGLSKELKNNDRIQVKPEERTKAIKDFTSQLDLDKLKLAQDKWDKYADMKNMSNEYYKFIAIINKLRKPENIMNTFKETKGVQNDYLANLEKLSPKEQALIWQAINARIDKFNSISELMKYLKIQTPTVYE